MKSTAKQKGEAEQKAGYARCVNTMGEGACDWIRLNGRAGLRFSLPDPEWMVISPLDDRAIALLCDTVQGREFLKHLDELTGSEATLFQAAYVVEQLGLPFERWSNDKLAKVLSPGGGAS